MAFRTALTGATALLLAIAAPASAAPTVQPTAPCVRYLATKPPAPTLGLTTSGWAANAPLTFTLGDATVGSGTADPTGVFATGANRFAPPAPKGNLQSLTLTAKDDAGMSATAPVRVVRLTVAIPAHAKPSKRVKYRAFGFQPGKRLYLFIRRGGRTHGRFNLGVPGGACGRVTKRLRYMPLAHWKTGVYHYWYAQRPRYSKKTRIYGYEIRIFKSVG